MRQALGVHGPVGGLHLRHEPGAAVLVARREEANYVRFWKVEPDPEGWDGIYRITVRVVAVEPGRGSVHEEVTLSTIRANY